MQAATLRGSVRDSRGKPIEGASVLVQAKDGTLRLTVQTDSQGNYSFVALHEGAYSLRAETADCGNAEIPSLLLGAREVKQVDLTMVPPHGDTCKDAAPSPQFYDEPQFTVAGVKDTTSLGGHGSDTVVRTRETLAKETASLGKASDGSPAPSGALEKNLRENVRREPDSFDANHDLGKILIDGGKAREAIPFLEHARQIRPGDYGNSYHLALANSDAGNYERARETAQALLAHNDKAELHHLLGDVEEKLGNSLEAVRHYQRSAELDPREGYLFDWGSELLLHHAAEPAVQVFTKGNRLFPRSVRMLVGLAAAGFARGSYDQAVQRICEASDLNPNDSLPYLFMGKMQSAEPNASEQVVEKLHRFAVLQPDNAEANYYYAVGLWKLRKETEDAGRAEQIESLLNKAIRIDPKFGAAYLQLGILHSQRRDYSQAISDYHQAIQSSPQIEESHYRLAQAYRQTGERDKAKVELQLYDQMVKESAQRIERERHEIRQFVYTLRDQNPHQVD